MFDFMDMTYAQAVWLYIVLIASIFATIFVIGYRIGGDDGVAFTMAGGFLSMLVFLVGVPLSLPDYEDCRDVVTEITYKGDPVMIELNECAERDTSMGEYGTYTLSNTVNEVEK